jgi:hypothetical protein
VRSAGEGLQFIEGRGSSPDLLRQIDLQAAAYIIENCRWSGGAASWSDPILGPDSRHAAELAQIVGDNDQPFAAGMTANLHIVWTAGGSRSLEFCPNLTVMRSRFGPKRQHIKTRNEMFDGRQARPRASRISLSPRPRDITG